MAAFVAILVAGLSKGGFGSGAAFAATPILALAVSPAQAAAILLPILMLMDLTGLYAYRKRLNLKAAWPLMAACIIGVALGWAFFKAVDEQSLRLMLGALALGFLAHQLLKARTPSPPKTPKAASAAIWGGLAGFTSFVAHAGGPPYQMYTIPLKLDKRIFAGTGVIFFFTMNVVKLVPYFLLGQFSPENLATSAVLLPVAVLATLLGVWLVKIVPQELFYKILYVVVLLVGLKLIYDGVSGLLA